MKNLLIFIVLILFSSCVTLELYPVKGTASTQVPINVIKAKAKGVMGNSGKVILTMPDGEVCKGRWSSTAGVIGSRNNVGLVVDYGQELGLSPRGNENRGYAMAVGKKGTSMEIEFLTGAGTAHGFGVAKDNKGNVYRVLF
jgi:hypothetical protein